MRTRKEEYKKKIMKHTTRKTDNGASASGPGAHGPSVRKVLRSTLPPTGRGHGTPASLLAMPVWLDIVKRLDEGIDPQEALEIAIPERLVGPDGEEMKPKRFAARIRYQFKLHGYDKKYTLLVPGGADARRLFIVDHETAAMHDRKK